MTPSLLLAVPMLRVSLVHTRALSISCNRTIMTANRIVWKIGEKPPNELASNKDPFLSTLIPRTVAWCSVDDEQVCLLDGFTAGCYTPPSVICAASTLPRQFLERLRITGKCTLSAATVREKVSKDFPSKSGKSFSQLHLKSVKTKQDYPVAVESSPIQMFCTLEKLVPLTKTDELLVLTVETFRIDSSILSPATEEMKKRPGVVAKIDADLIQPLVGVGDGRVSPLDCLYSMPRPFKTETGWKTPPFAPSAPTLGATGEFETTEWSFRKDGGTSPLGYNATTALIMPRHIGWISTYRSDSSSNSNKDHDGIPHIAPYSFFTDVVRDGDQPYVAFSAYRKNGEIKKDAHLDAEESGCFVYNMVTQDLAEKMNFCAAELGRDESEFELAGLSPEKAQLVKAPCVQESPIRYECEYVKTVDVASFSVVIGKVLSVSLDTAMLSSDGQLDLKKLKPITRLGYMDEYGVLPSS